MSRFLLRNVLASRSAVSVSLSTRMMFKRQMSNESSSSSSTHFGFKEVRTEEKQGKVNEVFDNVAEKYDLMNDVMSFGLHRLWKNEFIKQIEPTEDMKLIDVAGGTGDIAFRFLNYLKYKSADRPSPAVTMDSNGDDSDINYTVTVCDINKNMLEVGKRRALEIGHEKKIQWKEGNAENLINEPSDTYDVYTIAFGIRNCTHLDKVVKEAYRVLKPGGRFLCLEFSQTDNIFFKKYAL
jgi:2-methoxy-6-polyprenyl-1,4-benzoquinol methylase